MHDPQDSLNYIWMGRRSEIIESEILIKFTVAENFCRVNFESLSIWKTLAAINILIKLIAY